MADRRDVIGKRGVSSRRYCRSRAAVALLTAALGLMAAPVAVTEAAAQARDVDAKARDVDAKAHEVDAKARDGIVVEGNRRIDAETVRSYFHAAPGGRFDAAALDAGLKAL